MAEINVIALVIFYLIGLPFAWLKEMKRVGENDIPELLIIGMGLTITFYPIIYTIIFLPINILEKIMGDHNV